MDCEWDPAKNEANLLKHGFDFEDARQVLEGPHVLFPSPRGDEERYGAIGILNGYTVVVFYTVRNRKCRIISLRRARPDEQERFRQHWP